MATSTHGSRNSTFLYNETTTAPTATDDVNAGYSIGSQWFDTTADIIYQCIDTTAAAAVWKDLSTAGSGTSIGLVIRLARGYILK